MTWPTIPKRIFGHKFPPYPWSFNNEAARPDHYDSVLIAPGGVSAFGTWGNSAIFGGVLRDRPPFVHQSVANWSDLNYQLDIRNAIAAGLDGFTMDLLHAAPNAAEEIQILKAAAAVSSTFKVRLMPDMGTWTPSGAPITDADAAARIQALNLAAADSTPDGRLILAPFHAENWTPAKWSSALAAIESTIGRQVALIPCFLNYTSNIVAFMSGVKVGGVSRMYGASVWGNRDPGDQTGQAAMAADAHSKGLIWMQPVSIQDNRPYSGQYWEPVNTQNLRDTWAAACGYSGGFGGTFVTNGPADEVQVPTWDDFSEGAHMCPSVQHGWSYANLSNVYSQLWKAGLTPSTMATPTVDQIFLTYRQHNHAATPTGGQTRLMAHQGTTAPSDLVEVLTILTASSTVKLNVNGTVTSTTQPAGISTFTAPLAAGPAPIATVSRAGTSDLVVTGPLPVVASPVVQDLGYVAATASRASTPAASVLFGITDANAPGGTGVMLDTLEGAYTGGTGTGISNRVPIVHEINGWTAGVAAFGVGTRELALFNAGHSILMSFRADTGAVGYTGITAGTYDTVLNALGDAINALSFGVAVSGAQPGAGYNGLTDTQVRVSFAPQAETDTTRGTAAQFQAAWRYAMAKIKSRLTIKTRVRCTLIFSGGSAANGKALTYLPGITSTDFVDEIGVNMFPAVPYTTLADAMAPWKTWVTANTPGRKILPTQVSVHADPSDSTHQGTFMAGCETEIAANPTIYSGFIWDALPTGTIDDRNPAKSNNATLFTAFHDAVAAAVTSGVTIIDTTPPPAPTGVTVTAQTATTLTLTWSQQSVPDLANSSVTKDGTVIATPAVGVTSLPVTGLTALSSHVFAVAAVDTSGNVSTYTNATPSPTVQPGLTAPLPPVITAASITMTNLTGVASVTATDPASGQLVATWDWGDGTSDVTSGHTWAAPGTYLASVSVLSLVSNLTTTQAVTVVATVPPVNVTPNLGVVLPPIGGRPGDYGADLSAGLLSFDAALTAAVSGQGTPTAAAVAGATGAGTSPPVPVVTGMDKAGSVTFGTGSSTTGTGAYLTVTFANPKQAVPTVVIAPINQATAVKQPYVLNVSTTGFQVGLGVAGAASQANTVYGVSWHVTGS